MRGAGDRCYSWCGATAAEHRVQNCRDCRRIRGRAYRAKLRQRRLGHVDPNRPTCVLCGIARDNERGIAVFRYPLLRHVKALRANRCIGSIAICDACVVREAKPSPSYIRANGAAWGKAA